MFFSKPKEPQVKDVIFINEHGYLKALTVWLTQNTAGIICIWFQHDLELLRKAIPEEPETRFILAERLSHIHSGENKPLLFAGHYPIREPEINLCNELDLKEMVVYAHLDMALFKLFGAEQIQELMKKMGHQEDEPLSHAMITKSISRAQAKIAESSPIDIRCLSESEWMSTNIQPGRSV